MAASVVRDIQTHREDHETLLRVRPESFEKRNGPSVHEQIAQLSYTHWQLRGCPFGSPEEDWLEAGRDTQRLATAVT